MNDEFIKGVMKREELLSLLRAIFSEGSGKTCSEYITTIRD